MDRYAQADPAQSKVNWRASWNPRCSALQTSLYNFFRDYDPQTGRYLEADPIGQLGIQRGTFAAPASLKRATSSGALLPGNVEQVPRRWIQLHSQGVNLYGYAGSNPINFSDPRGTDLLCSFFHAAWFCIQMHPNRGGPSTDFYFFEDEQGNPNRPDESVGCLGPWCIITDEDMEQMLRNGERPSRPASLLNPGGHRDETACPEVVPSRRRL